MQHAVAVAPERPSVPARGLRFARVPSGPNGTQATIKRALDIALATLLVALSAPLMGLIWLVIKLDSNGPALICQDRVGRGLRPFRMYKFRSMVNQAESLLPGLLDRNETEGPIFKMRYDPRITRVGRYLRRLSMDELPQLINVLRGEMALVGPRPPFTDEVIQDYLRQAIRLQCPPGMTGVWQVSGRSDLSYEMMIGLDLGYALHWSLARDLAILIRTVPAVVSGRGAL